MKILLVFDNLVEPRPSFWSWRPPAQSSYSVWVHPLQLIQPQLTTEGPRPSRLPTFSLSQPKTETEKYSHYSVCCLTPPSFLLGGLIRYVMYILVVRTDAFLLNSFQFRFKHLFFFSLFLLSFWSFQYFLSHRLVIRMWVPRLRHQTSSHILISLYVIPRVLLHSFTQYLV